MKVLFVCSGNSKFGISPFIKSQGDSLIANGVDLEYFTIKGKGIKGYLSNIFPLRKHIKENQFDIIHAHYSLTAFVVTLANLGAKKNIVVSLMGSDVNSKWYAQLCIRIFNFLFWDKIIVKSGDMKKKIGLENAQVIPNGINMEMFKPLNKMDCKAKVGFNKNKNQVVWISDPSRYAKNFDLAQSSFSKINRTNTEFKVVNKVPHTEIPIYLNAADILLLSSRWEGSPNIIKEAMACNVPIVTTKVGDIEWLLDDLKGCFIADFEPQDVSDKLKLALKYSDQKGKTKGRERLSELGLDSETVAKRIIAIYKSVLSSRETQ